MTLDQLVNEVKGDEEKTASADEESDPLENVIDKEASLDEDTEKTAREWASAARELAHEQVSNIAEERQKIAEEHGKETLHELDKAQQYIQLGKQAAVQEMTQAAQQQKVAGQLNKIAEEHGEETAQDIAKVAYFDNVGRDLADQLVMSAAAEQDEE